MPLTKSTGESVAMRTSSARCDTPDSRDLLTPALLSAVTFIAVLWTIGGALDFNPGHTAPRPWLSRHCRSGLCLDCERLDGPHRQKVRACVREQEPSRGRIQVHDYQTARHGESIGEPEERAGLDRSLKKVATDCDSKHKTTAVSQTSAYIAPVLPVILCAPKFLDGSMWLGEVMQAASAFTRSLQLARRQLSQDGRLD